MFFPLLEAAAVGAALVSFAGAENIPTPTASVDVGKMTYQGCFSSSDPLTNYGPYTFQSRGNCQAICVLLGQPVMALMNGNKCFCGPLLPAANTQVDKDECNTPCGGYQVDTCGGTNAWEVYLDGLNDNSVANYDPSSSTSSAQPTGSSANVVTAGDVTTVVLTVSTSAASRSGSGASTAGIVAGVVVGVFALASIIGGVFLLLRNRKRKQAQEEERMRATAAAKSEFVE